MMISHAIRMWLLSLTVMSVVSWATAIFAFLVLYVEEALGAATAAMLTLWAVAVPIPVTFHAVRCWRRIRLARQVRRLAGEHARACEKLLGEIASSLR